MKCIILAAGYATRLYPLTENYPKPLLEVNGKKILDYLIDDLETSNLVDEYIIVSNHKFIDIFKEWSRNKKNVTILDDGSTDNENRLGAVKDIKFAVDALNVTDDCLILAGDNLLDFSLVEFIKYANLKKTSCVMRHYLDDIKKLQRTGVLEIDANDLVIDMEEKPLEPKSHYACPPFYFYLNVDLKKIEEALRDGCKADATGSFVSWLCKKTRVHAFLMPGKRYDIGTLESYEEIKKIYKGVKKI